MITMQCEADLGDFLCRYCGSQPQCGESAISSEEPSVYVVCVCVCVCVCVWGPICVRKPVYKLKTRRFKVPTMKKYFYYI